MQIKLGYSMGYVGTDSKWTEEIPQDVIDAGKDAIKLYIDNKRNEVWDMALNEISVWAELQEDE